MIAVSKLKGAIVANDTTQKEVAKEIGISNSTFYRKMKKGNFTVEEAKKIVDAVPLTKDEAISIFFAN